MNIYWTYDLAYGTISLMSKLLNAIRQAIEQSDTSRYRMSIDLGIDQSQLARIMAGKSGLSLESLEKLAEYLDLEITIKPKHNKRKGE